MDFKRENLQCDVLVLGGGLAGCMAGIKASEMGASTIIVEKSRVERSGCAATGLDHYWTLPPDKGVSKEEFIKNYSNNVEHLVDHEVLDTIVSESYERVADLERFGITMKADNGEFRWVGEPFIHPYKFSIHYPGRDMKKKMAQAARKAGAKILNRTMAFRLLTNDKKVIGATAFNLREGMFYCISAKTVILATGGATRLYRTPSGRSFSTFACPSDTGDGFSMAFHAGAELSCMEFSEGTAAPAFRPGSLGNFTGVGGNLVNVKGEPFSKTHLRFLFAHNFLREIEEGNGPLFVDTSTIKEEDWKWVEMGLGNEVPMFLRYLKESGKFGTPCKIAVEIVEYDLRDGRSGVAIDKEARASLEGLYAAGDVMGGVAEAGGPGAITMGWKAGKTAVEYSAGINHETLDDTQIESQMEFLSAPLKREDGVTWQEIESVLQRIMTEQVGSVRSEPGLKWALEKVIELGRYAVNNLIARDFHELSRCHEIINLIDTGRMCIKASLERTESRHMPYFQRKEYSDRNDNEWLKFVIVAKGKDEDEIAAFTKDINLKYRGE